MTKIQVRFWGVCGSVPTPKTPKQIEQKVAGAVFAALKGGIGPMGSEEETLAWIKEHLTYDQYSTFGGNTTCVEVRAGGQIIVLDMGTGIREFGKALMGIIFANKKAGQKTKITVFVSHSHWDHIQGLPFFDPTYLARELGVEIAFYGGPGVEDDLSTVLKGQMRAPYFPIDLRSLAESGPVMSFNPLTDGGVVELPGGVRVTTRLLDHPQRTFGARIEYGGAAVAFCTDHEPRDQDVPNAKLVQLARGADVFIIDCQYFRGEFTGESSPIQRFGWGHGYPEADAAAAKKAGVKLVVTTHHEPTHTERQILELAEILERVSGIKTVPAHEGLVLEVG